MSNARVTRSRPHTRFMPKGRRRNDVYLLPELADPASDYYIRSFTKVPRHLLSVFV